MRKLLKIGFSLAIAISLANTTLAEEFDPISDLANSDPILGLDLPSDLGDLEPLEIPATITPEAPLAENEVIEPTLPQNPISATAGSGGSLDDETEVAPLPTSTQGFYTPTPSSFFNSQIAGPSITNISHDYSSYYPVRTQLTPTGPAATLALALTAAIGLAIFLRKKFQNV